MPLFARRAALVRRLCCKTSLFKIFGSFSAQKMTKRRESFRSTVWGVGSFFVISVDAPRRALGRDEATFSLVTPHWFGVYVTKRAFSQTRVLVHFFRKGAEINVLAWPAGQGLKSKSVPGFWAPRIWKGCYPHPMRRATQPGALVAKALRKKEKARLRAFMALARRATQVRGRACASP